MSRLHILSITFATLCLAACVPSYTKGPDVAASRYCQRAVECDWIARDDMEDCVDDTEDVFEGLWPESQCEDGFVQAEWNDCMQALDEISCDNVLGALQVAAGACSASQVCK